jgi:hypothetical protein
VDRALDAALCLVRAHPDQAWAHLGVASVYERHADDPAEALRYCRRALALQPEHAEACRLLRRLQGVIRRRLIRLLLLGLLLLALLGGFLYFLHLAP